jgi:hypothetical protein
MALRPSRPVVASAFITPFDAQPTVTEKSATVTMRTTCYSRAMLEAR